MNLRVMGLEGLGVMLRQEESLRFGVGRGWMQLFLREYRTVERSGSTKILQYPLQSRWGPMVEMVLPQLSQVELDLRNQTSSPFTKPLNTPLVQLNVGYKDATVSQLQMLFMITSKIYIQVSGSSWSALGNTRNSLRVSPQLHFNMFIHATKTTNLQS